MKKVRGDPRAFTTAIYDDRRGAGRATHGRNEWPVVDRLLTQIYALIPYQVRLELPSNLL